MYKQETLGNRIISASDEISEIDRQLKLHQTAKHLPYLQIRAYKIRRAELKKQLKPIKKKMRDYYPKI